MEFPPLLAVTRKSPQLPAVDNHAAVLRSRLDESGLLERVVEGRRVALAVGSRGITGLVAMVRALAEAVRERGAVPFILPAMGSHGGATAGGQELILDALGVNERSCGAPVVSSMETVDYGPGSSEGAHVVVSRDAVEADAVILLNRIKSHTAFQGNVESGLMKMVVVGLGKEDGARAYHLYSLRSEFPRYMIELANGIMRHVNVLGGAGVVEDARGRTVRLEVIPAGEFESREAELLQFYKKNAPRLPFEAADVLIVERMGKDISGAGLDTNVIGRSRHPVRPEPDSPRIRRIWVRTLTPDSHGNAKGVGLADFISPQLAAEVDIDATIKNSVAALVPEHAFMPPAMEVERCILVECIRSAGVVSPGDAKIAWIRDTLDTGRILVSPQLAGELSADAGVVGGGEGTGFIFDCNGALADLDKHWERAAGRDQTGEE